MATYKGFIFVCVLVLFCSQHEVECETNTAAECLNEGSWAAKIQTCFCLENYGGVRCEKKMPECLNGGTLHKETKSCLCPDNATGVRCEQLTECSRRGTWDSQLKTCFCPENYGGVHCEKDMQDLTECFNGGTWFTPSESCLCPDDYTGYYCQKRTEGNARRLSDVTVDCANKCTDDSTVGECNECYYDSVNTTLKCEYRCKIDKCIGETTVRDCMVCVNDCSNRKFGPLGPDPKCEEKCTDNSRWEDCMKCNHPCEYVDCKDKCTDDNTVGECNECMAKCNSAKGSSTARGRSMDQEYCDCTWTNPPNFGFPSAAKCKILEAPNMEGYKCQCSFKFLKMQCKGEPVKCGDPDEVGCNGCKEKECCIGNCGGY